MTISVQQFENRISMNSIYNNLTPNLDLFDNSTPLQTPLQTPFQSQDNQDDPKDFSVIFNYGGDEETIKCSLNESMRSICEKFGTKNNVDISTSLLLYNGEAITVEDLDSKVGQLVKKNDKLEKKMSIAVDAFENRESMCLFNPNQELTENLIVRNSSNNSDTKKYHLKFFLILIVQHSLISFLVWLGFFLNINEIFIEDSGNMLWTFIPLSSYS